MPTVKCAPLSGCAGKHSPSKHDVHVEKPYREAGSPYGNSVEGALRWLREQEVGRRVQGSALDPLRELAP
jgi:hypothetical protein